MSKNADARRRVPAGRRGARCEERRGLCRSGRATETESVPPVHHRAITRPSVVVRERRLLNSMNRLLLKNSFSKWSARASLHHGSISNTGRHMSILQDAMTADLMHHNGSLLKEQYIHTTFTTSILEQTTCVTTSWEKLLYVCVL